MQPLSYGKCNLKVNLKLNEDEASLLLKSISFYLDSIEKNWKNNNEYTISDIINPIINFYQYIEVEINKGRETQ